MIECEINYVLNTITYMKIMFGGLSSLACAEWPSRHIPQRIKYIITQIEKILIPITPYVSKAPCQRKLENYL